MRNYQLVLLLKSDIKKEQKEKLFADVKSWAGEIKSDKVESLGERKLSYQIKHNQKGEYVVLSFESDRVSEDLNKKLLIRDEVLRHLLVRN